MGGGVNRPRFQQPLTPERAETYSFCRARSVEAQREVRRTVAAREFSLPALNRVREEA